MRTSPSRKRERGLLAEVRQAEIEIALLGLDLDAGGGPRAHRP